MVELTGSVIGRVRIEALIGRGGMGDVYRGFDEVLERTVAVKVIAERHRWSDESRARFRREAQVLARFQHPNVCAIHDVVESGGSDVLVLEYLEGTPLGSAGRELGRDRVLEIAVTVARVLEAAHAAGIVHRDLKPDNVMLLPSGQVKVLDFGLARTEATAGPPADRDPSAGPAGSENGVEACTTTVGVLVGTLQYMSPEQARGEVATAASDVFALGVLLHELLGSGRPYGDAVEVSALLVRVAAGDLAPPDSGDPAVDRLIADLTATVPEERPTAAVAAARLEALAARPGVRSRRRRLAAGAVLVAGALAVTGAVTWRLARPHSWLPAGERARVAILPFANDTGSPGNDWVTAGLPGMVAQTMGESGVSVLPVAEVAGAVSALGLSPGRLGEDGARALADAVGARVILDAGFARRDRDLVLAYRVFDRRRELARREISGWDLTEMANVLSRRMIQRLDPDAAVVDLKDAFSDDAFANRAYAVASATLATAGPRRARLYFQVCLDRDPTFSWARLGLAHCEERLGNWDEAETLARTVLEQARERGAARLEASALRSLGVVAQFRGDFDGARAPLEQALALARRVGDVEEETNCLNDLGRAALRQRRLPDAEARFLQALELSRREGDRRGEGQIRNNLGLVAWRRGDVGRARALFSEALAVAGAVADRDLRLSTLNNLGGLALQDNRLHDAESAFAEVAELAAGVGNRQAEISARNNLAAVAFYDGDVAAAETQFTAVLAIHRERGDRVGEATVLANLASMAGARGDAPRARERAEAALQIRRDLGDTLGQGKILATLGEVARTQGDADGARAYYAEARSLLAASGDRAGEVAAVIGLAQAAADRGDIAEARSRLEECRSYGVDDEAIPLVEARLLYLEGRYRDAVTAQERARRALGERWGEEDEAALELYREAARAGTRNGGGA